MDTFHCVKKSPPLVNEIEKVQKKKMVQYFNVITAFIKKISVL